MQITTDHVPDLARGAALLGTGGGGDPHIGALLARQALVEHGPIAVEPLGSIPNDALVLSVAMMGAPTVMVEKLPGLTEIVAPVRAVEKHLGRQVTHLLCAEVGGVNSTVPVAAAAALGLPLLDADGMGRAFPELQMVLPTLYGISASPIGFADEKGNSGVLDTVDNRWTERIARVACVEMGCSIMIATFAMTGEQARESLVDASLSRCLELGRGLRDARDEKVDPVEVVTRMLGGREIGGGKVADVQRATTTGFARGQARITSEGGELTLSFQNEHLVASHEGQTLVTTPDLIMVLEAESGEPITTEGLRYGQRVRVVAAPSDERWHSPEGLALAGPDYFGYDTPAHRYDGSTGPAGTEHSA